MELAGVLEQTVPLDTKATGKPELNYTLEVAVAYQERRTREWAERVCVQMGYLVGEECVRSSWWPLPHLSDPHVFADAVQAASAADIIVVSAPATKELSEDLWTWITAWLPRRRQSTGALVALLGVSEPPLRGTSRTREYLQAVAHKGGLDFLPHEQELPAQSLVQEIGPDRWWGINE